MRSRLSFAAKSRGGRLASVLDNIGLPYSTINFMHATSGLIGAGDADIMIALTADHRPTADYVRKLRRDLPRAFPGIMFYFLPADIVSQILNFGIPAPIDIQIDGADLDGNRQVADQMLSEVRHVPGIVDARIQQAFDYPTFDIAVDRTKAAQSGLSERDVANSVLNILSGSSQVTPMFFLNWQNGVNYNLTAEAPQYDMQSLQDVANIPVNAVGGKGEEILGNLATIRARKRDAGHLALQHPPHRRHLRFGAGPRSWRGREGHHAHRRMQIASCCRAAAS